MSKILPFSRKFPAYHAKAKQPTFFVEQILNQLGISYGGGYYRDMLIELNPGLSMPTINDFQKSLNIDCDRIKKHTIRAGHRWKHGEKFSPRVWLGRPYFPRFENGKKVPAHLIFAPDTEVKQTFAFELISHEYYIDYEKQNIKQLATVANNDGFTNVDDMELWFEKPFAGQIICWSNDVNYK